MPLISATEDLNISVLLPDAAHMTIISRLTQTYSKCFMKDSMGINVCNLYFVHLNMQEVQSPSFFQPGQESRASHPGDLFKSSTSFTGKWNPVMQLEAAEGELEVLYYVSFYVREGRWTLFRLFRSI